MSKLIITLAAVCGIASSVSASASDLSVVKFTNDVGQSCEFIGTASAVRGINANLEAVTACKGTDGTWREFVRDSSSN